MQRTRFSPRFCATAVMMSIGTVDSFSSSTMRTALRMVGSFPAGNSTSTTGPMTWTMRPMFGVSMGASLVYSSAAAPETISMSSFVMRAWRARL